MFYPVNGDLYRSNVVLHLPFTGANNSTTFTDVSPTPKTLTRYGDTKILTAQSKWGQGSGYFDGTGDFLGSAFNTAFKIEGDFTVESYCYFASDTGTAQVIASFYSSLATASNSQWIFYYNKTTQMIGFDFRASDGTYEAHATSVNFDLSTWYYIAGVRSGNDVLLFVDGVLLATIPQIKTISNPTSGMLGIGVAAPTGPFAVLNGYLQDVRITKGVARYTADFAVPAGPLPARLPELPVRSIIQPHPFHQIARLGL